jgi:hypothetical protein
MKTIKLEVTQFQAEKLGIVRCRCGHPPNNHFDWDEKPCAHCECKCYVQVIILPK